MVGEEHLNEKSTFACVASLHLVKQVALQLETHLFHLRQQQQQLTNLVVVGTHAVAVVEKRRAHLAPELIHLVWVAKARDVWRVAWVFWAKDSSIYRYFISGALDAMLDLEYKAIIIVENCSGLNSDVFIIHKWHDRNKDSEV